MALTLRRWLALALTGFFLAPAVMLDEGERYERDWTERDRLAERDRTAQAHVRSAANRLRILHVRDSIVQVAARRPGAAFEVDVAFDSVSRALVRDLVVDVRANRATAARVPSSVYFVLDTVSEVRGQNWRSSYVGALALDYLPPTESSGRCIVIARIRRSGRPTMDHAELRSAITRDRLLGPCAYFEQFGRPGRAIAEWMNERGWQFAQRGTWSSPPLRWLEGTPDSAWRERIDLQHVMPPVGAACAAGKNESCLRSLLDGSFTDRWRPRMHYTAGVLSTGYYNPFAHGDGLWLTRYWPLGAREWTLLSDMVRTVGPERFESFWTSDLQPEQAFRAATGESLAEWTRDWIEDTYHPQAGGPALPAGAMGLGALVLIAGIGLSILAARQRQTG